MSDKRLLLVGIWKLADIRNKFRFIPLTENGQGINRNKLYCCKERTPVVRPDIRPGSAAMSGNINQNTARLVFGL